MSSSFSSASLSASFAFFFSFLLFFSFSFISFFRFFFSSLLSSPPLSLSRSSSSSSRLRFFPSTSSSCPSVALANPSTFVAGSSSAPPAFRRRSSASKSLFCFHARPFGSRWCAAPIPSMSSFCCTFRCVVSPFPLVPSAEPDDQPSFCRYAAPNLFASAASGVYVRRK